MRSTLSSLAIIGGLMAFNPVGAAPACPVPASERVISALKAYLGTKDASTRTIAVPVSLSGSGARQVLVYVTGVSWCGPAGCPLVILEPSVGGYRVISRTDQAWTPVTMLNSRTHGWRDLVVRSGRLAFDGHVYRLVAASDRLSPGAGAVVIAGDACGTLLSR